MLFLYSYDHPAKTRIIYKKGSEPPADDLDKGLARYRIPGLRRYRSDDMEGFYREWNYQPREGKCYSDIYKANAVLVRIGAANTNGNSQ